jgi:transcriptional regulator with XRE-family HTH domain
MNLSDDLRHRVRQAREKSGLSKAAFGRCLNITGSAVSQWESGLTNIPLFRIPDIARSLDTSESWLAFGQGDELPVVVLEAAPKKFKRQ